LNNETYFHLDNKYWLICGPHDVIGKRKKLHAVLSNHGNACKVVYQASQLIMQQKSSIGRLKSVTNNSLSFIITSSTCS